MFKENRQGVGCRDVELKRAVGLVSPHSSRRSLRSRLLDRP